MVRGPSSLQPFAGYVDISIWVKNSQTSNKKDNKQNNKQKKSYEVDFTLITLAYDKKSWTFPIYRFVH